jgi:hypothetical protein
MPYLFYQEFSSDNQINISPALSQKIYTATTSSLTPVRQTKSNHWREMVKCHQTIPEETSGNLSDADITAKDSAKKKKRKFVKQVTYQHFNLNVSIKIFHGQPRLCF